MMKVPGISPARLWMELKGERTTTITVAKAYCTPSRHALTKIFAPISIWFDAPMADTWGPLDEHTGIPLYQTATITVKRKQARWAEYNILSAKTPQGAPIFQILGRLHEPRNKEWAARRKGLPTPWAIKSGRMKGSWVEYGCKEAERLAQQRKDGKVATLDGHGGILYTSERNRGSTKPRKRSRRTRARTRRK